jgi:hypothetical protein
MSISEEEGLMRRLRNAIRLLAMFLPLAGFISCGGGGGGGTPGSEIAIGLTTQGSATTVESGGSLVIRANVTNADNMEVTWSMTASVDLSCCGGLTPQSTDFALYEAPSPVPAAFTVTITATSVQNTAKCASITLTVNAQIRLPGSDQLDGQYAFLMQGFNLSDGRGIAVVGSFQADGWGNIAGGTADYYLGPNLAGTANLAGSYTVGTDRRGTVNLGLGATTLHFAAALGRFSGGIATKAAILQTDTGNDTPWVLSGTLWSQDPAWLAPDRIVGPFAFLFNGWNGAGPRGAMGGTVNAGGNGTFTGGLLDTMTFGGTPVVDTPWTGSFPAPSSAGRSVLAAPVLTGATGTAVIYVADAGHLLALVYDPAGSGRVFSGGLWAQAGPFGLDSLNATCVTVQTANHAPAGYTSMTMSGLALFTADGAGNLAASSVDQDYAGNFTHWDGPQYTYTVTSNGQASILSGGVPGGKWYLTGPNRALMLGFDPGMSVGAILPQTGGPFSAASVNGTYFAIQQPGGALYSDNTSGVATATGDGTLARTLDLNTAGAVVTGSQATGSFAFTANGRAMDADNNVIYVISPDAFALLGTTTAYPVIQVFER